MQGYVSLHKTHLLSKTVSFSDVTTAESPNAGSSRYPSRSNKGVGPVRLVPTLKGQFHREEHLNLASLCGEDVPGFTPNTRHLLAEQASGYDVRTGFQEVMHPGICQSPMALQCAAYKAKKASDPDYPSVRQALTGPNAELWWDAMDKELQSIIDMDSWEIVS